MYTHDDDMKKYISRIKYPEIYYNIFIIMYDR